MLIVAGLKLKASGAALPCQAFAAYASMYRTFVYEVLVALEGPLGGAFGVTWSARRATWKCLFAAGMFVMAVSM